MPVSDHLSDELPCARRPTSVTEVDEAGYLHANPDAVRSGLGAQAHFESVGRGEGRYQWVNETMVARMRARKLRRVAFRREPAAPVEPGKPLDFLSPEIIAAFDFPEVPPISAHQYSDALMEQIRGQREETFLDLGAGLRESYQSNVLNADIYPWISTDVVCVGEDLPFADEQFDHVICLAVLEHTRRPWEVAREIRRVLKPGGTVTVDYPFMQPVHGYPHHYFNATPQGCVSLFSDGFDILSSEVGWHQHPIIGLNWILTVWRNGLPADLARDFAALRVADLLEGSPETLMQQPYCMALHPEMKRVIASGSMLKAMKRCGTAAQDGTNVAELNAPVAARTHSSASSVHPLGHLQGQLSQLRRQNATLLEELFAMRMSRSWRFTSPLRAVARWLLRRQA